MEASARFKDKECRQTESPGIGDVVAQFNHIKEILGFSCINIASRLKLCFIPRCLRDVHFCHSNHSKISSPQCADFYQDSHLHEYLQQDRALHSLKFVEDISICGKFPGQNILLSLLRLILTVNTSKDSRVSSTDIIRECVIVIENILFQFPSCWSGIENDYQNILLNPMNVKKLLPNTNMLDKNLINFVVDMLEQLMGDDTEDSKIQENSEDSEFINFHDWELKNVNTYRFDNQERSEKMNRLFIVLHFITKILEMNLSIWMLRHPTRANNRIMFGTDRPLVSLVFFRDMCNQRKDFIDQLLRLYVNSCKYNYPQEAVSAISRFVGLFFHVVNISEENNREDVVYPNIANKTKEVSCQIFSAIVGNTSNSECSLSAQTFFAVIHHLRVPYIRYLLIYWYLKKIHNDSTSLCNVDISIKTLVECLATGYWMKLPKNRSSKNVDTSIALGKYPVVKENNALEQTSITRIEYLSLLLEAIKSYCEVFEIEKISTIFKSDLVLNFNSSGPKVGDKMYSSVKYDISLMQIDIEKLEMELNMSQMVSNLETCEKFDRIYVDEEIMLRYRTDIKYLLILENNLKQLSATYNYEFQEWSVFISNLLKIR